MYEPFFMVLSPMAMTLICVLLRVYMYLLCSALDFSFFLVARTWLCQFPQKIVARESFAV